MTALPGPHGDYILDRRRLRRKVTFWRVLAVLLAILVVGAIWWRTTSSGVPGPREPHIARVDVTGVITGDRQTLELLRKIGKSNAKAVLLSIESPGGTTTGAERLYDEIRLLAKKKPVVAVVGTVAASGAYIAAIATDHIFAYKNSLVGSIGVLAQVPNVSQLLDKIGVKVEITRSAPLKATPNGLEPTPPEARKAMEDIIANSYDWFKKLVQDRRKMKPEELAKVISGRVFTGQQGIALKLVDAIGGEREAIAWLVKEKKIPANLKVREWKKDGSSRWSFFTTAAAMASIAGFNDLARNLRAAGRPLEIQALDGLLAVWQGSVKY